MFVPYVKTGVFPTLASLYDTIGLFTPCDPVMYALFGRRTGEPGPADKARSDALSLPHPVVQQGRRDVG